MRRKCEDEGVSRERIEKYLRAKKHLKNATLLEVTVYERDWDTKDSEEE